MTPITGKELGALLFAIHHHVDEFETVAFDEEGKDQRIVYLEDDLLPILKAIGLPEPEWGDNMSLTEFLKSREK